MIHPEPTTKIDPTIARATIIEVCEPTATCPLKVVLSFPNNSYKTALETSDDIEVLKSHLGEMVMGRIFAKAKRIDQPNAGGRRIDPCFGTPRRVMGTVIATDPIANVLVIDAGAPFVLTLTAPGQKAAQFADADFVACDVLPGASFTLIQ